MKTTPFFYFSGDIAYLLVYLEYVLEAIPPTIAKLFKNLEVIVDNNLDVVAMRFDRIEGARKNINIITNNWALTETGACLDKQEQKQLFSYCKDLQENGRMRPSNLSGSKTKKIHECLSVKMCSDIERLMVFFDEE